MPSSRAGGDTGPIDVTYNVPTMTDEYHHYRVALQPMPWESTDDPAVVVWHRAAGGAVQVWVIPTDEEKMIARATLALGTPP